MRTTSDPAGATTPLESLFKPLQVGPLTLRNRLVMAPMTRSRADDDGVIGELAATYYAQRASAGLIITEGIFPTFHGKGYVRTPGLATDVHTRAWRRVTDAVHAAGGTIAAQLMHTGRISHPTFLPQGALPVAPSAIRPAGAAYSDGGPLPFVTPRALTSEEIAGVVSDYVRAAERAFAAGFDAIELHAGSGYLPEQFLCSGTNRRTDRYGGSLQGRLRFPVELLEALAAVRGADRVGVKLSPELPFNDIVDDAPHSTYAALVEAIAPLGLAWLHVVNGGASDHHAGLRRRWPGRYFAGGGFTGRTAASVLAQGAADAAVFGVAFIANPDLPERLRLGLPLATADRTTFYAGGARGYVDYPRHDATKPSHAHT